uniref:Uncharacterized protein n=1 Tax=Heterorhabditis bacteriophora TaxID=37862 RepID=A0A1I7WFP8_HETBA
MFCNQVYSLMHLIIIKGAPNVLIQYVSAV